MSRYKREMEQIKLSEEQKNDLKNLYAVQVNETSEQHITNHKYHQRRVIRVLRPLIAAAVILVMVGLGLMAGDIPLGKQTLTTKETVSETKAANTFTVTARAQDMSEILRKNQLIPNPRITFWGNMERYDSDSEDYDVEYKKFSFWLFTEIYCRGENIVRVTYTVENADMYVMEESEMEGQIQKKRVEEYSVDYDHQVQEHRYMGIEGKQIPVTLDEYMAWECGPQRYGNIPYDEITSEKVEAQRAVLQKTLEDIRIKCEVTYADGSKEFLYLKPVAVIRYPDLSKNAISDDEEEYAEMVSRCGEVQVEFEVIK